MDELLQKLLPDLEPETLRQVAQLTGAPGLGPQLAEQCAREWEQAHRQLQELEDDPLFAEREHLLSGELPRLESHRAALAPLITRCLAHPRFVKLLESGYGTPAYRTATWRLTYHLDRKAARELEALCAMPFSAILVEVAEAMEASLVLQARIAELKERLRQVEALERQRNQLRRRLQRLPQVQLETARWKLRRHLEASPELLDLLLR